MGGRRVALRKAAAAERAPPSREDRLLNASVGELVAEGRLENVPIDLEAAANMLAEALRHLDSAAAVAATDPNGAYQLLYDAARKGVAGHMLAHGLRARNRQGAHQAVVLYAEEALVNCRDVR